MRNYYACVHLRYESWVVSDAIERRMRAPRRAPNGPHVVRSPMSASRPDPWDWRELLRERIRLVAPAVQVPLAAAAGRLLAAELRSPEDVPALAMSAMDGFAVRRSELTAAGESVLPVAGDLPARPGGVVQLPLGHALRIMTGAPVPRGADAVIPVEDTDADPFGPSPGRV